jgi:hypothetical protein
VTVWVIRVWEEQAPEGEEPLEWIVLTSVPTTSLEQAWERADWYGYRLSGGGLSSMPQKWLSY